MQWNTFASMILGPLPPRQAVYLCLDTECSVVYFGDQGMQAHRNEIRTIPNFKVGGSDLACFCFLHDSERIRREVEDLGASPTAESIRRAVEDKNCACEVHNPSGRCCLPEVSKLIERVTNGDNQ